MRLRDRRREVARHLQLFGEVNDASRERDSRGRDYEAIDKEVEGLSDAFRQYVNVITGLSDVSNGAFDSLLHSEPSTKDIIDITDIFDYEEDNDETGEFDDPLFNGSLGKDQGVATDDSLALGDSKQYTRVSITKSRSIIKLVRSSKSSSAFGQARTSSRSTYES